jgi:dethiobiotin synthetase
MDGDDVMSDPAPQWMKDCLNRPDSRTVKDILTETDDNNNLLLEHHASFVGLYLVCGEWNSIYRMGRNRRNTNALPFFAELMGPHDRQDLLLEVDVVPLSSHEELDRLCGDNDIDDTSMPCPPQQLPVLLLKIQRKSMEKAHFKYLTTLDAHTLERMCREGHAADLTDNTSREIAMELGSFGLSSRIAPPRTFCEPLRIFIAGDRMSVGKTSVCMGILGSLVRMGYAPEQLAYTKPATQNESPQLVQRYCETLGIECVPVGPVVYYRGFTRAFLAGETEPTEDLLEKVSESVDKLAKGKQVVIIDGVGFPAVGSICGTDNASVALASSYPGETGSTSRKPLGVLLVGGPGVGSAVDAFNLNATYFEMRNIPVLGAIYNKLSLEGFYSLENCKKQISLYFSRNQHQIQRGRKPFGFCPLFAKLQGKTVNNDTFEFIRIFEEHVDMPNLLESACPCHLHRQVHLRRNLRQNDRN